MTAPRAALRRPAALRAVLDDPVAMADVTGRGAAVPGPVTDLLSRLRRLQDLPFQALVPDARALPPESARFFAVDRNWLDALIDGALATAVRSAPDAALMGHLGPRARAASAAGADLLITGFALRSAAVAHWPELRVTGCADAAGEQPVEVLRQDRPADTVLIVLFGGAVRRVAIALPAQGRGFGLAGEAPDQIRPRGLGGSLAAGTLLPPDSVVDVPMRADPAGRAIVDVAALHGRLSRALSAAYAPAPAPALGPAGLGLQLVITSQIQLLIGDGGWTA
jgi:hypothetical protein